MKKLLTLFAALMIIVPVLAQVSHSKSHQVSIGGGQEWNAFLMPNTLLSDGEIRHKEDLWDNGTFQAFSISNSFRWEKAGHKLRLKLNGSLGIFQTEQNANRHTYTIGATYRVKYASKRYFEFAPEYFRKKREGLNGDQALLATPFSFQQFRTPLSFDFYLGDGAWVKTEAGYMIKSYDRPTEQVLRYQAPFLGISLSKKWTMGEYTTKLTFNSLSQRRKYTDIDRVTEIEAAEFDDEEDEFFEGDDEFEGEEAFRENERNWSYFFNDLTYSLKTSDKKLRAEIGLYSTVRLDARKISDYREVGPGIHVSWQTGKLDIAPSVRYSLRKYSKLAPGDENGLLLQYNYLRVRFNLNYHFDTKMSLYANYLLTRRTSNNPNFDRVSFREYFYAQGQLGIRWKW